MAQIYDVAIIGGGPAGYVAAIRAAQLGGSVVLFEKDTVGGTCLNRGCIPTKTYIKTAEIIRHIAAASVRGVKIQNPEATVDMAEVVAYKNGVVKKLTTGVAGLLKANGVAVVKAKAVMRDATHIEAAGDVYEAKNTILCGGSVAGHIPVPGAELAMTSDDILDLESVPKRLAIVGGGVIGCEIATAFAAFGSVVTIVEALPRLVANMDADVSNAIARSLKKARVGVVTGAALENIEKTADGLQLHIAGKPPVNADAVLLSVGRRADLECLGGLAGKITQERGKIAVDAHMRTNVPNVYAAGDLVAGTAMLAHAAFKMGEVAAANTMGHAEKANLAVMPSCLYTIPEAASVGLSEEDAAKTRDIAVGKFNLGANGRSLASGETDGFVKVVIDKKYGEILGVHMVGGVATEMITEAAVLIDMQITAHEAAAIIHPHPTYSEALMEACADALGRCIHLPPKKK